MAGIITLNFEIDPLTFVKVNIEVKYSALLKGLYDSISRPYAEAKHTKARTYLDTQRAWCNFILFQIDNVSYVWPSPYRRIFSVSHSSMLYHIDNVPRYRACTGLAISLSLPRCSHLCMHCIHLTALLESSLNNMSSVAACVICILERLLVARKQLHLANLTHRKVWSSQVSQAKTSTGSQWHQVKLSHVKTERVCTKAKE